MQATSTFLSDNASTISPALPLLMVFKIQEIYTYGHGSYGYEGPPVNLGLGGNDKISVS